MNISVIHTQLVTDENLSVNDMLLFSNTESFLARSGKLDKREAGQHTIELMYVIFIVCFTEE